MPPVWGGWRWASSQRATSELSFKHEWDSLGKELEDPRGGVKIGGRVGHGEPGEQQEHERIAAKTTLKCSR